MQIRFPTQQIFTSASFERLIALSAPLLTEHLTSVDSTQIQDLGQYLGVPVKGARVEL